MTVLELVVSPWSRGRLTPPKNRMIILTSIDSQAIYETYEAIAYTISKSASRNHGMLKNFRDTTFSWDTSYVRDTGKYGTIFIAIGIFLFILVLVLAAVARW